MGIERSLERGKKITTHQQLQESHVNEATENYEAETERVLRAPPQVYPRPTTAASGAILRCILKKSYASIWEPLLSVCWVAVYSLCGLGSGNRCDLHLVTVYCSAPLSGAQVSKDVLDIQTV